MTDSPAVAFLKALDSTGRHNLVALDPEKQLPPRGRTIKPGRWDQVDGFVTRFNGTHNVYFSVNEPVEGAPHSKLSVADIGNLRAICADLDAKTFKDGAPRTKQSILDQIDNLDPLGGQNPTLLVDSGGGYGAFWKIPPTPATLESIRAAESLAEGIRQALGGDPVGNVDRIMRLPGTINRPDAAKRARGRTEVLSRTLHLDGPMHSLDAMAKDWPAGAATTTALRTRHQTRADADGPGDLARAMDFLRSKECPKAIEGESGTKAMLLAACALRDLNLSEDRTKELLAAMWVPMQADPAWVAAHFESRVATAFASSDRGAVSSVADSDAFGTPDGVEGGAEGGAGAGAAESRDGLTDDQRSACAALGLSWGQVLKLKAGAKGGGKKDGRPPAILVAERDARKMALAENSPFLIDGFLDADTVSSVYGGWGSGKSFAVLHMALTMSAGKPWNNMATKQGFVVYVAAEGARGMLGRIAAYETEHPDIFADANLCMHRETVNMLSGEGDVERLLSAIRALEPARGKPVLIIIDTMARAMAGGDENSSETMGKFIAAADALRMATGAHILLVHHTGKDASKGARGHSSLGGALDTMVSVTLDPDTGLRTLEVVKQKELEAGLKIEFRIKPVVIGTTPDGTERGSGLAVFGAVRRPSEGQAGPLPARVLTDVEQKVLDVLGGRTADKFILAGEVKVAWESGGGRLLSRNAINGAIKNLAKKGCVVLDDSVIRPGQHQDQGEGFETADGPPQD